MVKEGKNIGGTEGKIIGWGGQTGDNYATDYSSPTPGKEKSSRWDDNSGHQERVICFMAASKITIKKY